MRRRCRNRSNFRAEREAWACRGCEALGRMKTKDSSAHGTPNPFITKHAAAVIGDLHGFDRLRIHWLAGKGAIEIDHMQVFEALRGEALRLRRRIEAEHGRARHVALFKTHALAVLQVDGGKQDHGFHFRKFEIKASPKRWLFSG